MAALTLLAGAAWALGVGVAASIALLLQRTARPHVALIGRVPGTEHYRNVGRHDVELTPGVVGLRIDESLLFTNARQLSDVVAQHVAQHPDAQRVVLLMSPVNRIDFSGLEALRGLQNTLSERGIRLDLSEVKGPVLDALRGGLLGAMVSRPRIPQPPSGHARRAAQRRVGLSTARQRSRLFQACSHTTGLRAPVQRSNIGV